jgi:F-type H+-transporting ATPase subunit a
LPSGTPLLLALFIIIIELLAYLTRIFSLGIRLTVNIITGHTLIKVLNGFILLPGIGLLVVPLLVLPLILELLIGYLQAYIFSFIATITLKDFAIGSLLLHIGIEDNF